MLPRTRPPCSGSESIGAAVRLGPPQAAIPVAAHLPPVLVHQLVMEEAQQDEVVEVRGTSVSPPDDVVRLSEPASTASAIAQQAARDLRMDPSAIADLHGPASGRKIAEASMHDHRCTIGVGVVCEAVRADGHEASARRASA